MLIRINFTELVHSYSKTVQRRMLLFGSHVDARMRLIKFQVA